ncbi:MAG: outer membrane beta-barrel protein [Cyclobacteriaceae bacterium]
MKRTLLILCLVMSFAAEAQKGFEVQLSGGIAFIGSDPWMRTPALSVAGLYTISPIIAFGPIYSTGLGSKFYVDSKENNYDASISEIGLLARFTFLRSGKFKMYGTTSVAQVNGKVDSLPDFRGTIFSSNPPAISIDDSSVGFGFGTGASLNLGGKVYLNILEFQMRVLKKDFMDMDKGFQGSVGPLFSFKSGISFIF